MPSWKKVIVSGSDASLNSLNAPSITGSLQGTASYALTSGTSQNASDILIYVKNTTGQSITKGNVVRIIGSTGDNALIATASYESDSVSANTLGITNSTIANDAFGYVITEGTLLGINTDVWTAGQLLFLGAAGSITGSAPLAPLHAVRLGQVLRVQQNNGSMYVRIDNGYEINELHDVDDNTTTSSYGDLLVKSGSVWSNSRQLTGSYGLTGSLTITGSTNTDLVRITQTGTGNAFVVEDSTNPDASPFVITNAGRVGIGIASPTEQLDVSGSIEIIESASYKQDGYNVIYIAKGADVFYANTVAGASAGTTGLLKQTVYGWSAGASSTGSYQSAFGTAAGYLNKRDNQSVFGHYAGYLNTGSAQTALGMESGYTNIGDNQTAVGYQAGYLNTGSNQTAIGWRSGWFNSGSSQTAVGIQAGQYNIGLNQTVVGVSAGQYNTGSSQTAIGYQAGYQNSGSNQTAIGLNAGFKNAGASQTVVGLSAGNANVGTNQTALGYLAGYFNSGSNQTAVGVSAGYGNSASFQTAVGVNAGYGNAGINQTAIGHSAGFQNSGSDNTNIGYFAGVYTTGATINSQSAQSVFLGSMTYAGGLNRTNQIVIGYNASGIGSNSVVLGNDSITTTALKGFVGIGITTPTASLHITNTSTSASFLVEDSANPDATPFVITNAGNVGIGTTTPSHKLHLYSDVYTLLAIERSGSFNAPIQYTNSIGTMYAGLSSFGKFTIGTNPDLTVNADARLTVSQSGYVGIGTTAPRTELHVSGSTLVTGVMTIGTGSVGPNENTLTLGARDSANEGGQLGFNAPGGTYTSASFFDLYQNRLRLLRGTNAGSIGEVASWNMGNLQMALPAYTSATSFTGTVAGILGFDSAGNVITTSPSGLSGGATNYLARWSGPGTLTTGSVFDNGTNVGIGTTTPSYKLDVSGDIRSTGAIYANANGGMYFQGGDDAALYDINVANTMGIYGQQSVTEGAIKLGSDGPVLYGSGSRLGIGKTTPNATLDVNGNAIITGSLTVTSNINNTLFTSTTATANVGSTTIYSISTSSYDGAWFEYVARSGSNARAGQIMAIDSGSAVNFTETTTTDFGSTSGLSLGVYIVNGAMALTASAATAGWSIKTIVRSI